MSDFAIEITGDRSTTLRFENFPKQMHARILVTMQEIETRLEAAVVASEPRGATGQLQAMTGGRVYDHGDRIAAVVGVRVPGGASEAAKKAMALEYGSSTPMSLRAHVARLSHLWRLSIPEITVLVPSHSRTPNILAKRFLRDPIEAMRSEALTELRLAVDTAATEAS